MEGFVAVTRCAVGVLCSLGRNDFFLQGGSIFPDARRPCPDRSSGCCVPAFPKGGLPDVGRKDTSLGGVRETAAGASAGGKRPSSYRASRCGFPVPRPPVRRDPSSSRGGARHGLIGAGRGEEGGARKKDRREGRPFLPPVCTGPDRLRWSDDSGSSPAAVVCGRIAPASYVVRLGRERSVSEGKDGICAAENSGSQKVRSQSGPFAGAP